MDVFNPKTVQATMGAIARVKVHYCDLPKLISSLKGIPVYGTFLDGNVIYSETLSANGLIVMGNEGNGISREVEALINRRLYIPNYPQERDFGVFECSYCHSCGLCRVQKKIALKSDNMALRTNSSRTISKLAICHA